MRGTVRKLQESKEFEKCRFRNPTHLSSQETHFRCGIQSSQKWVHPFQCSYFRNALIFWTPFRLLGGPWRLSKRCFWQTVILLRWHPPFSSSSSISGVRGAKSLVFVARMQYQNFRQFSSKPPVFGRGQNDRLPKRQFRQPWKSSFWVTCWTPPFNITSRVISWSLLNNRKLWLHCVEILEEWMFRGLISFGSH